VIPLADALAWLAERTPRLPGERIPLADAAGRVLAAEVAAAWRGRTAAIDGQAVRAAETEGASDYAPLPVGGAPVVAGAALPAATDAVLPLAALDVGPVARAAVARGHGVVQAEAVTLPAGLALRPPHLALLAQASDVEVVRQPVVSLRVAGAKAGPEALAAMLRALVAAAGGVVAETAGPDLLIHAGRSGPGTDDDGAAAFDALFAHGVLIRPGETAALGSIAGRPALLLPGAPLACATAFALLAAPALRRMAGLPEPAPVAATLARKLASGLGQIDAVRVRLADGVATPLGPAEGGSLAAGAGADGLVLVPAGSEGYPGGATVWVHPLP